MEQGTWFFIVKLLLYVALCSTLSFLLGLFFGRPKSPKSATPSAPVQTNDETARLKKLQEKLQTSEATAKTLCQQIESMKADSVAKTDHAKLESELVSLGDKWEAEKKRASALEAELRKAQDTTASLNARLNADAKTQSSRVIQLENELSQAREALSLAGAAPALAAPDLSAELDRAKETVANAMRLVGEARKRETALQQELDSWKKRAESGVAPRPSQLISSLPFAKHETISVIPSAAERAKEEVARLNAKRDTDLATKTSEILETTEHAIIADEPVIAEQLDVAEETVAEEPVIAEEPAIVEPTASI
jgi:hypothetical protein